MSSYSRHILLAILSTPCWLYYPCIAGNAIPILLAIKFIAYCLSYPYPADYPIHNMLTALSASWWLTYFTFCWLLNLYSTGYPILILLNILSEPCLRSYTCPFDSVIYSIIILYCWLSYPYFADCTIHIILAAPSTHGYPIHILLAIQSIFCRLSYPYPAKYTIPMLLAILYMPCWLSYLSYPSTYTILPAVLSNALLTAHSISP